MSTNRIKRINSEYQKAAFTPVDEIVKRENDQTIVTITKVDVTPDLSDCKIFVSLFSVNCTINVNQTLKKLNDNAPKVREHLAHTVNLRTTPRVRFYLDESAGQLERINTVINKINNENDAK